MSLKSSKPIIWDEATKTITEGRYSLAVALISATAVIIAAVITGHYSNENHILQKENDSLREENRQLQSELSDLRKNTLDNTLELSNLVIEDSSNFWQESNASGDALNRYGFDARKTFLNGSISVDRLPYAKFKLNGEYTRFSGRIETAAEITEYYFEEVPLDIDEDGILSNEYTTSPEMAVLITTGIGDDETRFPAFYKEISSTDKTIPFSVDISNAQTMEIFWFPADDAGIVLQELGIESSYNEELPPSEYYTIEWDKSNFNCYVMDTELS